MPCSNNYTEDYVNCTVLPYFLPSGTNSQDNDDGVHMLLIMCSALCCFFIFALAQASVSLFRLYKRKATTMFYPSKLAFYICLILCCTLRVLFFAARTYILGFANCTTTTDLTAWDAILMSIYHFGSACLYSCFCILSIHGAKVYLYIHGMSERSANKNMKIPLYFMTLLIALIVLFNTVVSCIVVISVITQHASTQMWIQTREPIQLFGHFVISFLVMCSFVVWNLLARRKVLHGFVYRTKQGTWFRLVFFILILFCLVLICRAMANLSMAILYVSASICPNVTLFFVCLFGICLDIPPLLLVTIVLGQPSSEQDKEREPLQAPTHGSQQFVGGDEDDLVPNTPTMGSVTYHFPNNGSM